MGPFVGSMNEQIIEILDGKPDPEPIGSGALIPVTPEENRQLSLAEIDLAWDAISNTRFGAKFNKQKFEARRMFGKMMGQQISVEFLGVNVLESAEMVMEAIRNASAYLDDPKATIDQKIAVTTAITIGARAVGDLSERAAKMYGKTSDEPQKRTLPSIVKNIAPNSDRPIIVAQNVQFGPREQAKSGPMPIIEQDY